jgi:hypothetical protein
MTILMRATLLLSLAAMAFPPAGRAGDGDYGAGNDTASDGPAYFGFVKDTRGSPVADARVVLQPKAGEPVVLKTNVLGLYRSHVSKEARPDDVSVSCDKSGYKQANVIRRTPPGATVSLIETNCTLQRL